MKTFSVLLLLALAFGCGNKKGDNTVYLDTHDHRPEQIQCRGQRRTLPLGPFLRPTRLCVYIDPDWNECLIEEHTIPGPCWYCKRDFYSFPNWPYGWRWC